MKKLEKPVLGLFPKSIKQYIQDYGLSVTDSDQLDKLLSPYGRRPGKGPGFSDDSFSRWGGVISDDFKKIDNNKCYVANLQRSDQGGSHWVGIYNGHYFDPYGVPPTKSMSRYARYYNTDQYQGLTDEYCGWMTAYWCYNIMNDLSPIGDLLPGQYKHNERVLTNFFSNS